jgi:hypothetical protein
LRECSAAEYNRNTADGNTIGKVRFHGIPPDVPPLF